MFIKIFNFIYQQQNFYFEFVFLTRVFKRIQNYSNI